MQHAKQPEQAEAERPEVVGYRSATSRMVYEKDYGLQKPEPMMLVAQHERIVGALTRDHAHVEEHLSQQIDILRINLAAKRDNLDAAMARVAELTANRNRYGVDAHYFNKNLQRILRDFESFTPDELARSLIILAKVADEKVVAQHSVLEKQEPVATIAKVPGEDWNGLHFYRDLQGMQPGTKLYAAPVAQAQHSVPEGLAEFSQFLSAVMDAAGLVRYGRRSKELSEYLGAQCMKYRLSAPVAQAGQVPAAWYYDAPSQAEAAIIDIRGMWGEDDCPTYEDVAAALRRLLAAAPGKEVPQAWLDVQAERRRQVEVEGYHGFRDNHYISYELSKAARAYIEVSWHALSGGLPCKKPESWPWMAGFKWSDGRTMLVKACALALAEIERLDRAAPGKEGA
ncbi:hypothetical protein ISE18_02145 [Pseudomonas aeruginosa]|nr:hypothetical protein [Pseudomonas aeruginosa]